MNSTSALTGVELSVLAGKGNSKVDTYQHEGKTFIEGKVGSEYSLKLRNNNGHRVKVVVSVDGVSVITGKPASDEASETGYVMGQNEDLVIKGYRLDDTNVAAFKFVGKEAGYATAEKGMEGTSGVIGVRVFKEKIAPAPVVQPPTIIKEVHHHHDYHWPSYWGWSPWVNCPTVIYGSTVRDLGEQTTYSCGLGNANTSKTGGNVLRAMAFNASSAGGGTQSAAQFTASNMCSQAAAPAATEAQPFVLGSTFGQQVESRVTNVKFETECCLGAIELYYTTRAGLQALGIDLTKKAKVAFPQAFDSKYCSPPKNWTA